MATTKTKSGALIPKDFFNTGIALYLLLFFAVILIFNDMSKPGLASFDDAYYAQKTREMIDNKNIITPHYSGEPDFINPPLFTWMMAVSFLIFGQTAFAARFATAICGFITIIFTYKTGAEVKDRRTGWLAAFFLATSYIFLKSSRRAMMDVPFMMFATLALYFIIKLFNRSGLLEKNPDANITKRFIWTNALLFGLFAGLGGQIKTVFMIFIIGIPVLYILITGKKIGKLRFPVYAGILLAVLIIGWWVAFEFFTYRELFIDDYYAKMLSGHIHGMPKIESGKLGYLIEFARHFWLWLPLTLWAIWKSVKEKEWYKNPVVIIMLLYGFFPLLVLSFAGTKYIRYVLFTFPPMLILTAYIFTKFISSEKINKFARVAVLFLAALSTYLVIRPFDVTHVPNRDYILLGEALKSGELVLKNRPVFHWRDEYYENNNPMLYYTGRRIFDILRTRDDIEQAAKYRSFYILVRHSDMADFPKQNTKVIIRLQKRNLLFYSEKLRKKPTARRG